MSYNIWCLAKVKVVDAIGFNPAHPLVIYSQHLGKITEV
jgi:hypothetical protein